MTERSVLDQFLDHFGRMLLSRSRRFREVYAVGDLLTTDKNGYLGVKPSFGRELFNSCFFEMIEYYRQRGKLPPRSSLIEMFIDRQILRQSNPISRFYIRHYPLPVVKKKEFEFLVEVADCLPPCIEFLIKTPLKKRIDTGDSKRVVDETNGRRLLTAKEAGRKLNKKASTIRYWARKNRIAAEFTQDKSGRKRLLGIPASAVDAYLAAKTRSSKR